MNHSTSDTHTNALGNRYLIDHLIGEGAFARTYRARDARLSRTVAVKILRAEYAANPDFLARFQREARAAANIDHPNVVDVFDYGEQDGECYLVLQYVPGRDLRHYLDEHTQVTIEDAIRLTSEMLAGLAAVHRTGIVHRDIKPQNVLIGWDGIARVTDFGIAHERSDLHSIHQTSNGMTLGTPAYMAPEQAKGELVSQATDLYAVGIVLFELLTGHLPFTAENSLAMMVAQVEQPPPRPSSDRADIPPGLDAVVLRALAKAPGDRFPDALSMEQALVGATKPARREAGGTPPASARVRAAAQPTAPVTERTPRTETRATIEPRPSPPKRRSGLLPLFTCLVVVLALVGAIAKAMDGAGSGDESRTPTHTVSAGSGAAKSTATDEVVPTATVRHIVILDTPEPTATDEPPPTATDEPPPTEIVEELPTDTPEVIEDEGAGGVPTIAPSNRPTETSVESDSVDLDREQRSTSIESSEGP